ncbi:hypothetical protein F5884DRAFT_539499 [Xylogone sp. PMI_703]|nr:hypothetical protein F5884DRAFT_539499 [Xylogone sp. PMI_703]
MRGPTTALLYHVPACGDPISVYGAASHSPALRRKAKSPTVPGSGDMPLMHHFQASLQNVARVEFYIHPLEDTRCSGILITYEDGREQALGQRRIGLPNVEIISVSRPCRLHFKPFQMPDGHWRLKVMFSSDNSPRSVDADDGWFSQFMMGAVRWSLSRRMSSGSERTNHKICNPRNINFEVNLIGASGYHFHLLRSYTPGISISMKQLAYAKLDSRGSLCQYSSNYFI